MYLCYVTCIKGKYLTFGAKYLSYDQDNRVNRIMVKSHGWVLSRSGAGNMQGDIL